MVQCQYCRKTRDKNKNVSFHQFPKDDELRKQWVRNMGRDNWMPKEWHMLCSEHFSRESIDFRDSRSRLRKGSVPTIFNNDKENSSAQSNLEPIVSVDKRIKLDETPEGSLITARIFSQSSASILNMQSEVLDNTISSLNHPLQLEDRVNIASTANCTVQSQREDLIRRGSAAAVNVDVILHDHTYAEYGDVIQRKLDSARLKIDKLVAEKKTLHQKNQRHEENIRSLKDIVTALEGTGHLQEDGLCSLQGFGDISVELFKRMHGNVTREKRSKEKYSPQLRCFALTLHFYSPKAYNYVRETLEMALPHPSVLRSWYSTIDAEPGFSEECFNTLKIKNEEYRKQNRQLICAMMIDEMGIKSGLQRTRDGKMRGYVDIGVGTAGKFEFSVAKNALVFLVVSLDESWKLPVAFFLIDGMPSQTKKNLMEECLTRLANVGVQIVSLTLDGPAEHLAALNKLGAIMTMDSNAKPCFPHPVEGQPDVYVIIDPCHDLKNIRNALGHLRVLLDKHNMKVEWKYIEALAVLQQDEGLRLGNKLRITHIEYKKMIMKVYLAAQTLSSSVADAIEFCWKVLRLPQFEGCEATVNFIRKVDCIFDFLNVRNPWGKGFKSPLTRGNEHVWRPRILEAIQYLADLKLTNNTPIFASRRKTGFIGFYTAVLSSIALFDMYVKPEGAPLKYLLTYKVSQDHLELFFAAIRARSGWCPNPTVAQFISAYKRLLIRHDVQIMTGNTQLMDQTKILHVSSSKTKRIARIDRYDLDVYSAIENRAVQQKFDLNNNDSVTGSDTIEELNEFLDFAWAIPSALTDFASNAVSYIAGYIVRKLSITVKCSECISGCKVLTSTTQDTNINIALIFTKNRGGLIIPSDSVITICSTAETLFRRACNCNMGMPPKEENFPAVLANAAYRELLLSRKKLFSELDQHFHETFSVESCVNHKYILMKRILIHYIEIRMYAATKNTSISITGTKIRHFLTRQIVWAHQ